MKKSYYFMCGALLLASCNKEKLNDLTAFQENENETLITTMGLPTPGFVGIAPANPDGSYTVNYGGTTLHFDYILKSDNFIEGEPSGGFSVGAQLGDVVEHSNYFIVIPLAFPGAQPDPNIYKAVSKYNQAWDNYLSGTSPNLSMPIFSDYLSGPFDGATPQKGHVVRTHQTTSTLAIVPELKPVTPPGGGGGLPTILSGYIEHGDYQYSFVGAHGSNKIVQVFGHGPNGETVTITDFDGTYSQNGGSNYYVSVTITLASGNTITLEDYLIPYI